MLWRRSNLVLRRSTVKLLLAANLSISLYDLCTKLILRHFRRASFGTIPALTPVKCDRAPERFASTSVLSHAAELQYGREQTAVFAKPPQSIHYQPARFLHKRRRIFHPCGAHAFLP